MCRDDVPSPFVEGSRLQRLRESIGPLFIRGHKYQADAAMVVFMPGVAVPLLWRRPLSSPHWRDTAERRPLLRLAHQAVEQARSAQDIT